MTFKDDLVAARNRIVASDFAVRNGQVVPETSNVGYDQAVKLSAAYLYADMVDSSGLVAISPRKTVGKVLRLYLDLSVRIIRRNDGHIRSFDGDRVMGVFVGSGRVDGAVKAAMQIKWACINLIQPTIDSKYESVRDAKWKVRTGCGIASGDVLIIRGGVRRSSSDLVSIGLAPNFAAKLSDMRDGDHSIRIGSGTYGDLSDNTKYSKGRNMWEGPYSMTIGGVSRNYYRSNYHWSIS